MPEEEPQMSKQSSVAHPAVPPIPEADFQRYRMAALRSLWEEIEDPYKKAEQVLGKAEFARLMQEAQAKRHVSFMGRFWRSAQ